MAQNGIIGDMTDVDLPVTQVDKAMLDQEQRLAKYSKSKEFQELKAHLESRIEFYQQYLPDGRPVGTVSQQDQRDMWGVANIIIGEFKAVLGAYENAKEAVDEATKLP